jgi:hypothetical protein
MALTSDEYSRISPMFSPAARGVRPAAMLGSQGLLMTAWVPAIFFLAVLIDYSTGGLQEVHMVDSTNMSGLLFSICRSVGSVLTSLIGSALLV